MWYAVCASAVVLSYATCRIEMRMQLSDRYISSRTHRGRRRRVCYVVMMAAVGTGTHAQHRIGNGPSCPGSRSRMPDSSVAVRLPVDGTRTRCG
ncbi:hypothetical protein F5Y10DRAFT_256619 [Nemania abortiva]|nr:hypothetical protein F5Y10DRAFT_256619 [Nemania abortiva]